MEVAVGVGVRVGVAVGVAVGDGVRVTVRVGEGVEEGVAVAVGGGSEVAVKTGSKDILPPAHADSITESTATIMAFLTRCLQAVFDRGSDGSPVVCAGIVKPCQRKCQKGPTPITWNRVCGFLVDIPCISCGFYVENMFINCTSHPKKAFFSTSCLKPDDTSQHCFPVRCY